MKLDLEKDEILLACSGLVAIADEEKQPPELIKRINKLHAKLWEKATGSKIKV